MQIKDVSPEVYDEFLQGQERYLYQQTARSYARSLAKGQNVRLIGLIDASGKMVLGAKILYLRYRRLFESVECYFGPIFDQKHPALLAQFFQALWPWLAKQPRVIRFRIAPLIARRDYREDPEGRPSQQASCYEKILDEAKLERLPFDFDQVPGIQTRFFYVKDIAGMGVEEILDSCSVSCRNDMRKAQRFGLQIEMLKAAELERFNRLLEMTIERSGMPRHAANVLQAGDFDGPGGEAFYPMAVMDFAQSMKALETEAALLEEARDAYQSQERLTRKMRARMRETEEALAVVKRRMKQVEALAEKTGEARVDMAGAQFFKSPSDLVYAQSVADATYFSFAPVYAIHEHMLNKAAQWKLRYYNFFAVHDPKREDVFDTGVEAFKKNFNGHLEEWLGSYERRLGLGRWLP